MGIPLHKLVSSITKICTKLMGGFYFFYTIRLQQGILRAMTSWTNCRGGTATEILLHKQNVFMSHAIHFELMIKFSRWTKLIKKKKNHSTIVHHKIYIDLYWSVYVSIRDSLLVGHVYPPVGKNMATKFQDRNFRGCCLKFHANTNIHSQRSNNPLFL